MLLVYHFVGTFFFCFLLHCLGLAAVAAAFRLSYTIQHYTLSGRGVLKKRANLRRAVRLSAAAAGMLRRRRLRQRARFRREPKKI